MKERLLVMDAGNTNLVVGLYVGSRLVHRWRLRTDRKLTEDELGIMLRALLQHHMQLELSAITGVSIASVVPVLNPVLQRLTQKYFTVPPVWTSPALDTGLSFQCEDPEEVGADLIANAVAAQAHYGVPVIVVDFGTATTFTVVNEQHEFLGGAIAPGMKVAADSLFQAAAGLTPVDLQRPERVVGRNTREALYAGIYYQATDALAGLVMRIQQERQQVHKLVITGGLASLLGELTVPVEAVDPDLTLKGLRILYERNRPT